MNACNVPIVNVCNDNNTTVHVCDKCAINVFCVFVVNICRVPPYVFARSATRLIAIFDVIMHATPDASPSNTEHLGSHLITYQ